MRPSPDVFGTAAEFFFQDSGSGPLRADYLIGEDIADAGGIRSLNQPAFLFVDGTRTLRFPDHYSRRLRFGVVVLGPGRLALVPLAFDGTRLVSLRSTDFGAVHWNSTILTAMRSIWQSRAG